MHISNSAGPADSPMKDYTRVSLNDVTDNHELRAVPRSSLTVLSFGIRPLTAKRNRQEIFNRERLVLTVREIARLARSKKVERLLFTFQEFSTRSTLPLGDVAKLMTEAVVMANYEFLRYKTPGPYGGITHVHFQNADNTANGFELGEVIATVANDCRDWCNTPACDFKPADFARIAREIADRHNNVTAIVHDKAKMEELGMGLELAVGRGSEPSCEPRMVILEYRGATPGSTNIPKPLVFLGKGVCYDTGGLSIKPSDGMLRMYMDMSGGAAVMAIIDICARLGVKQNIVVIIMAVENSVGSSASRPGDIHTSMSGRFVENTNTDAEGRLILADGITYIGKFYSDAVLVIDMATLTGAAHVALGDYSSGVMSPNLKLVELIEKAGSLAVDPFDRLPYSAKFRNNLDSDRADIKNAQSGKDGGASVGASFIGFFVELAGLENRWAHCDIAPSMLSNKQDHLAEGAKAAGVLMLTQLILDYPEFKQAA